MGAFAFFEVFVLSASVLFAESFAKPVYFASVVGSVALNMRTSAVVNVMVLVVADLLPV